MPRPKLFDRDTVLDKATALFWRKGYETTSIQDIVKVTAVNRASLYTNFGDKKALYLTVLNRYASASAGRRRGLLNSDLPADKALKAYLDRIIDFSLGEGRRLGCLLTNAATEAAPLHPDIATELDRHLARTEEDLAKLIVRGQEAGIFAPGLNPMEQAHFLLGVISGLRVMARSRPDRKRLEDIVRVTMDSLSH